MASEKRSYEERIAELQEKQKQLKEQEKRLRAQQSQEKRKLRTKHLIEMGGTIYSILGREFIEGDIERLTAFLKGQENRGEYFSKAMNECTGSDDIKQSGTGINSEN
ncbi:MAG: relaxasome subunit MobC [Oscillospiraceae bacterium]|nr:relaxasome subunit MobC [Oscillospiraceae bacterium]MDO5148059.1 relaxasome subunit MobC [Oscillospiraceae bacterium]